MAPIDYNINNVLIEYQNLVSAPNQYTPMLVLQTENGERRLAVVQDKNQVPWFQRLLAYFGFGDACLNNVANFIIDHHDDVCFDIQANVIPNEPILTALQIIHQKIDRRNAHHIIKANQPTNLLHPVSLLEDQCAGAIATTCILEEIAEALDLAPNPQILDGIAVNPARATMVLGDGTRHATYAKGKIAAYNAL